MPKMGQHGDDLVLVSAGGDQRADSLASSQIVQKLEFVLYPHWAASNVDFFNCDKPTLGLAAMVIASV